MPDHLDVPDNTGKPGGPLYRHPSPVQSFEMEDSVVLNGDQDHDNTVASRTQGEKTERTSGMARHTIGLLLLLCVVFLWTLSNFLGSDVLSNDSYAKPFFLTYVNTAAFTVLIIPSLLRAIRHEHRKGTLWSTTKQIFSLQTLKMLWRKQGNEGTEGADINEAEAFLKPDHTLPTTSTDIQVPERPTSLSETLEAENHLGLIPTARLAFYFCMLWFTANYFAMSCLQYTTVASTTILTSTSSVWTLLIGALTGTEMFTWRKLCGVLGSLLGVVLISHVDFTTSAASTPESSESGQQFSSSAHAAANMAFQMLERALDSFPARSTGELALGDALALLSAILYGFYTIALKSCSLSAAPREIHMPTFFGLVGVCNIVLLLPLFPILHFTGIEVFQWPPTWRIWSILIGNSVASLSSDVAWAYAMIFTTPLLVTVALSLTIPLSLVGEMVVQGRSESWLYWVGAMIVVGSFVFVEREESKEEEDEQHVIEDRVAQPGNLLDDEEVMIGSSASESRSAPQRNSNDIDQLDTLLGSEDEDDDRRDKFHRQATGSLDLDR